MTPDISSTLAYKPFTPRDIRFIGVRAFGEWRIKLYSITVGDRIDEKEFADGLAIVTGILPEPDPSHGRPGVGFAICHQSSTVDYVVLGWWSRENELPVFAAVRDRAAGESWRIARTEESACVWDLQVIAAERDAYVGSVLSDTLDAGVERYLSASAFDARL